MALARELKDFAVTVAQVSVPTRECPHSSDCAEACQLERPYLVSLCDANHQAWNSYGRPLPDTVFLVDHRGTVLDIAPMVSLEAVAYRAEQRALMEVGRPYGAED